jgi:phosphoenolpyruvate carboxykinase (ATP)
MKLGYTRAMVRAALAGQLDWVSYRIDGTFGFEVPTAGADVPAEVLDPRGTWADPSAYDRQAAKLGAMFRENFERYTSIAPEGARRAGPTG